MGIINNQAVSLYGWLILCGHKIVLFTVKAQIYCNLPSICHTVLSWLKSTNEMRRVSKVWQILMPKLRAIIMEAPAEPQMNC